MTGKKVDMEIRFCAINALLALTLLWSSASAHAWSLFGDSAKDRQAKALAMWKERCKKAGVFIHRTVDNVEGIYLIKLRPEGLNSRDQYRMDDPYGSDLDGNAYVRGFLQGAAEFGRKRISSTAPPIPKGYIYVEAIDPSDGQRYRYTGSVKVVGKKDVTAYNIQLELKRNPDYDLNIYEYVLDRQPASDPAPRYGLTYEDISAREERDHWIAGSSLRVIDLQTNEVIAERIGYMVDLGQGNESGGRAPWLLATRNACPSFGPGQGSVRQIGQTREFLEQVLHPKIR